MTTYSAANRSDHVAEFDIELGRLERACGLHLGGLGRLQRLAALIDDGFGHCTGLDQGQSAVELAFGQLRLGASVRELAVGLLGDRLERTGIDDVQEIAGTDEGAVAELDIGDKAADPGADLN